MPKHPELWQRNVPELTRAFADPAGTIPGNLLRWYHRQVRRDTAGRLKPWQVAHLDQLRVRYAWWAPRRQVVVRDRQQATLTNRSRSAANMAALGASNRVRSADAASRIVDRARVALAAGAVAPRHLAVVTARVNRPDVSVEDLARGLGISRHAVWGILRRAFPPLPAE